MGSFRSCRSDAAEKARSLKTLSKHGVETTVDRGQKENRICQWILDQKTKEDEEEEKEEIGLQKRTEALELFSN